MLDENWHDRETKASIGHQIETALIGAVIFLGLIGSASWLWGLFTR